MSETCDTPKLSYTEYRMHFRNSNDLRSEQHDVPLLPSQPRLSPPPILGASQDRACILPVLLPTGSRSTSARRLR